LGFSKNPTVGFFCWILVGFLLGFFHFVGFLLGFFQKHFDYKQTKKDKCLLKKIDLL